MLASANHSMTTSCSATEQEALPINPSATAAYCWEAGDAATQLWLPQGITTSGDAEADGLYGGDKVILSGWSYNGNPEPAGHNASMDDWARVAFINANDPTNFTYRWVFLVVPTSGGTNFRPLISHLGGMAWYGDKLFVTAHWGDADNNQIYVFSMSQILQAQVNSTAVGKVSGGYAAGGYQYVMPAIGSYSVASGVACNPSTDTAVPCFDAGSLDRSTSPVSLLVNDWFSSGGTQPARLIRYNFGSDGNLSLNASGQAVASEVYETPIVGIQGSMSHAGQYYVADARGSEGQHGIMNRLNATTAGATFSCDSVPSDACWAQHSEGISLWGETVWSQTEWATNGKMHWIAPAVRRRVLFAMPLSSLSG
ncbi:hypothetical protein [Rugosimonospora africana]|uniref:hypothetical protein n=1 Tax=Rugosimonospora africana TaxID=556532 RepID=UPI001944A504|nr:hypothetical protein [Rugosimonospora africana]